MSSQQFSVRIPPELDLKVKEFAKENNVTKTKVMIDALKQYLGCMKETSLNQEIAEIKGKIIVIEGIIKTNSKSLVN